MSSGTPIFYFFFEPKRYEWLFLMPRISEVGQGILNEQCEFRNLSQKEITKSRILSDAGFCYSFIDAFIITQNALG